MATFYTFKDRVRRWRRYRVTVRRACCAITPRAQRSRHQPLRDPSAFPACREDFVAALPPEPASTRRGGNYGSIDRLVFVFLGRCLRFAANCKQLAATATAYPLARDTAEIAGIARRPERSDRQYATSKLLCRSR